MGSYLTYYDGKHQFLGYKNKCEKNITKFNRNLTIYNQPNPKLSEESIFGVKNQNVSMLGGKKRMLLKYLKATFLEIQ